MTRWHNLHFASRLLRGDLIGGPVKSHFGDWVHDIPLTAPGRRLFLHCDYWRSSKDSSEGPEPHIQALHDAIGLDCRRELREHMDQHSPLMYLDA